MKKLVLSLIMVLSLVISVNAAQKYNYDARDFSYQYNENTGKCETNTQTQKLVVVQAIQRGDFIIDQYFPKNDGNDAIWFLIAMNDSGKAVTMVFVSDLDICNDFAKRYNEFKKNGK